MKLIKLPAVLALSLFFYSCASTPSSPALNLEEDAVQEVLQEQNEDAQTEPESENSQDEEIAGVTESTASPMESDAKDEKDERENSESRERQEIPAEQKDEKPVYEPIEDIQCYYESDPEPVYMQPTVTEKPREEDIEIPIQPEESDSLSSSSAENPEIQKEIPAEEIRENAAVETAPGEANGLNEANGLKEANRLSEANEESSPSPEAEEKNKQETVDSKIQDEGIIEIADEVLDAPEVVEIAKAEETPEITVASESTAIAPTADKDEVQSENYEGGEEKQEIAESKLVVVPSRSASMKNNQYIDIVYPGKGWIYLGEEDGKSSMRYFGRKIGEKNTVFSLRSREEGSTILHFYKNDALTGKFIDDYLQVDIKGINRSQEHAVAPSYEEAVPPRPERNATPFYNESSDTGTMDESGEKGKNSDADDDSSVKTVVTPASAAAKTLGTIAGSGAASPASKISGESKNASAEENNSKSQRKQKNQQPSFENADDNGSRTLIQNAQTENNQVSVHEKGAIPRSENSGSQKSPIAEKAKIQDTSSMTADDILSKARESFREKKYKETLAYLEDFFTKATTRVDEGLFLQGQTFESNSSVRNIKSALDTYETIVRRYPQSVNWAKANERITYLRKFYFNIR